MILRPWIEGETLTFHRKPKTLKEFFKVLLTGDGYVTEEIVPELNGVYLGKWLHTFPNAKDFTEEGLRSSCMSNDATKMIGIRYETPVKTYRWFKGYDIPYCFPESFCIVRIFDLSNESDVAEIYAENKWMARSSHYAFVKHLGYTFAGEGI